MKIRTRLLSACLAGIFALGATPAHAIPDHSLPDIANSTEVLDRILPGIRTETSDRPQKADDDRQVDSELATEPTAHSDRLPTVTITPTLATKVESVRDGLTVLSTDSEDVKFYSQPLDNGARVISALDSDKIREIAYEFRSSEPLEATKLPSGGIKFTDSEGFTVGSIRKPWAVDSKGDRLNTSLEWQNGTIVQHVDITSATSFPVLADPAWDYIMEYDVEGRNPRTIWNMLHGCFNCYFPVSGAPQGYPVPGQLLPLTVGPMNFECRFRDDFYRSDEYWNGIFDYWGFTFDSTENHVDGMWSHITFTFQDWDRYGEPGLPPERITRMRVDAHIENDFTWVGNTAYRTGALMNWAQFALNLQEREIA